MVRRKAKPGKGGSKAGIYLVLGFSAFFVLTTFYLWQRERMRQMLMDEQALLAEINRLEEENRRLELDVANLGSLESLRNAIDDDKFGFPGPDRVMYLHWYRETGKRKGSFLNRAAQIALDWLKEGLDVNQKSLADSL
jgi:hypothetical protein